MKEISKRKRRKKNDYIKEGIYRKANVKKNEVKRKE